MNKFYVMQVWAYNARQPADLHKSTPFRTRQTQALLDCQSLMREEPRFTFSNQALLAHDQLLEPESP
jgi:hypothetical protein